MGGKLLRSSRFVYTWFMFVIGFYLGFGLVVEVAK